MQHLNYFTLKAVAQYLSKKFVGGYWLESFAQQKDELIIALESINEEIEYLRVSCSSKVQYVIPVVEFNRKRLNTVNLFKKIERKKILSIAVIEGERIIVFTLEGNYKMILKMHGNRSNILLIESENE